MLVTVAMLRFDLAGQGISNFERLSSVIAGTWKLWGVPNYFEMDVFIEVRSHPL